MSGLTLRLPHCVHHTVIHGHVLGSQAVHLQIQRVFGIVFGDGELALHSVCIAFATSIIANPCDPLQPLPWSLVDPVLPVATEDEFRGHTGESQGPPQASSGLPQTPPAAPHPGHLQTQDILVRKLPHPVSLTHIHSQTQGLLFSMNYLLK